MPHLIIEYSRNLRESLGPDRFLDALHDAANATGEFPNSSLRSRAVERQHYRVGDGHQENGFIHIVLRIRPGRERDRKVELGQSLFLAATAFLEPVFASRPLGLTLELEEIDIAFRFLKNNIDEHWSRTSRPPAVTSQR
jgi:5-carboxymethyl-2-hydroxymuconate isomerase